MCVSVLAVQISNRQQKEKKLKLFLDPFSETAEKDYYLMIAHKQTVAIFIMSIAD